MQAPRSLPEPVLVTGATGFIGSYLVRALRGRGYKPLAISRSSSPPLQLDLTDLGATSRLLEEHRPATIIHLAGTRGGGDPIVCGALNFQATAHLLEEAVSTGVERVVMLGTAEEYGDQRAPLGESLPTKAVTPYGISKANATQRALMLHARDGCPVVVLRPFTVYGPGQPRSMFVAQAIDSACRGVAFEMTRGEQMRDLVFVEDIVAGILSAATVPGIEGSVINLGSGTGSRLVEVAELIWRLTGSRAPLHIGARDAPEADLFDTWADTELAERLLGWRAAVGLEEGLKRTIELEMRAITNEAECQAT